MSDHITTYGGTHFVPARPEKDKIHITDIAHALSLICRGNGQVKTFFSVGQHCINCALEAKERGYGRRIILACLLHDAGEAYMSDVPSPLKRFLKDYEEMEERILDMIYTKYLGSGLTEEEKRLVKEIDRDFLYFDLRELLNETTMEAEPAMRTAFSYEVRPFSEVEQQYLQLFWLYYQENENEMMQSVKRECSELFEL